MVKNIKLLVGLGLFLLASPVYAATVYYQPTPYPSNVTNGVHIWDGFLGSYYNKTFTKNDELVVGGWGDTYRSYIKFDTEGLPANVSNATLWLWASSLTNPTPVNFYKVTSPWNNSMTWAAQPSATLLGTRAAPTATGWWGTTGTGITSHYNSWAANPATNYGWRLDPQYVNNNFDRFVSSRNGSDGGRPLLQLIFTPPVTVPNFKMPLPGGLSWRPTTEAGGWDCMGSPQAFAHKDNSYFSLDFSWTARDANGNLKYGDPNVNPSINIPIIAAAAGKVAVVGNNPDHPNGYYVVLDHDSDGNINTGFTTWYVHLKNPPSVTPQQNVDQGTLLGYMGKTPISAGYTVHLHFGVKYNGSGAATTNTRYAIADGWILKSFQTECKDGVPIRYYRSSNRTY